MLVYIGYTRQESDFKSACPKMVIKNLGYALKARVGRISRNACIFLTLPFDNITSPDFQQLDKYL